jgi:hypothetical protein
MSLELVTVQCPYCWEEFEVEVEVGDEPQSFIQDCSVCCRPIQFESVNGEDGVEVNASRSD